MYTCMYYENNFCFLHNKYSGDFKLPEHYKLLSAMWPFVSFNPDRLMTCPGCNRPPTTSTITMQTTSSQKWMN